MKKQICVLLALLSFGLFHGQVRINDGGNFGLETIKPKENANLKKISGSPYLDDEYKYGTLTVKGKEPLNVFLRYDVSTETFEIKTDRDSPKTYALQAGQRAVYVMDGQTFVFDQLNFEGERITGHFIEHFKGDKIKLLEKPVVEITEAVKARTGYGEDEPPRMNIESQYYVVWEDGRVERTEIKHRDVKKLFESKEAKKYLDDNRIRSLEDLIGLVAFLDQH